MKYVKGMKKEMPKFHKEMKPAAHKKAMTMKYAGKKPKNYMMG